MYFKLFKIRVPGSSHKLTYCGSCSKTLTNVTEEATSCPKCKSTLVYKCGNCKKVYLSSESFDFHVTSTCGKESEADC